MAELHISPLANDDLFSIKEHIGIELGNPIAATNTLRKILNSIKLLLDFPLSGAPLANVINIETDYRFVISNNYISFYRYIDDAIYVDRILYAKRDFTKILFSDISE